MLEAILVFISPKLSKLTVGLAIRGDIVSCLITGIRRITQEELRVVQFNCRIRSGFRSSRLPSIHFAG
jgi:hypothetical protein